MAQQKANHLYKLLQNDIICMELIASMLSIVKNVSDTDREFKLMKQKLEFGIKKATTALKQFENATSIHKFVFENLERHLENAQEQFQNLENLLSSSTSESTSESLSLKDKIKYSLPFNNFKENLNHVIEDLRQATEELTNSPLTTENQKGKKRPAQELLLETKAFNHQQDAIIDNEIDDIYGDMGPTIQESNACDFAQQLVNKNKIFIELVIELRGKGHVLKVFDEPKLKIKIEKVIDRAASSEDKIELYNLGRLNFKPQYGKLVKIYPDLDKISKQSHFKIFWRRRNTASNNPDENSKLHQNQIKGEESAKRVINLISNAMNSQKKEEEADIFFSVPCEVESINGLDNMGQIWIEKQSKKVLYKMVCEKWVKVQQQTFELLNGEEVATAINMSTSEPDLYFKATYMLK